jgi:hypothetical protein
LEFISQRIKKAINKATANNQDCFLQNSAIHFRNMKNHLIVLILLIFLLHDVHLFHVTRQFASLHNGVSLSTGLKQCILRSPQKAYFAISSSVTSDVSISKLKVSDIKDIVRLYTSKKDPGLYIRSKLWFDSFLKIAFPKLWKHSIFGLKIKDNDDSLREKENPPSPLLIGMVELSSQPLNGQLPSVACLRPYFYRSSPSLLSLFTKQKENPLNMQPYITNLVIHKAFRRKGLALFLLFHFCFL